MKTPNDANLWQASLAFARNRDFWNGLKQASIWGLLTGPIVSFLISGGLSKPVSWLSSLAERWELFIWALPLIGWTWAVVLTWTMSYYRWVVIPRCSRLARPGRQFLAIGLWGFVLGFVSLYLIDGFLNGLFGISAIPGDSRTSAAATVGLVGIVLGNLFHLTHLKEQRLREEEARREELERHRVESELMNLNMRIRPHFFFNALNTLSSLIDKDTEQAQEFLVDLADLFRQSFGHGRSHHTATWGEERLLLERYLGLESRRFGNRFQTEIRVAADDGEPFPAFLLQPLVENAIHHGIATMKGTGSIRLEGGLDGENWNIAIGNSTEGKAGFAFREGHALAQIRERLELMNGDLRVTTEPGWFSVQMSWTRQERES